MCADAQQRERRHGHQAIINSGQRFLKIQQWMSETKTDHCLTAYMNEMTAEQHVRFDQGEMSRKAPVWCTWRGLHHELAILWMEYHFGFKVVIQVAELQQQIMRDQEKPCRFC